MQNPAATLVLKGPAEQRIEAEYGEPAETVLQRLYFDEKLTQSQVAERLGVSNATVSRLFTKYGLIGRHPREFRSAATA